MPTVSPNGGQSLMDGCPWVQKDSIFALRSMSGHGICLINTNSKLQNQREVLPNSSQRGSLLNGVREAENG